MKNSATSETPDTAARLRRAITRLNRRLRQSSLGGISPAQASMLAVVNKLGSPSLGDLAVAEQIQPPSVTRMVRTLADAGWVVTTEDEHDRRCTRVSLTPAGHREVREIRERKNEFLAQKLRALSPTDQARVEELVALLEQLLGDQ